MLWYWRWEQYLVWVLTIFNEGVYRTLKVSVLIILVWLWNHARIRFWSQPVLCKEGKVSCSRKQRDPLMGFSYSRLTEYESDALPTARLCHSSTFTLKKYGRNLTYISIPMLTLCIVCISRSMAPHAIHTRLLSTIYYIVYTCNRHVYNP